MTRYDQSYRHHGDKFIAPTWFLRLRLFMFKFERAICSGSNRCYELSLDRSICELKVRILRRAEFS